MEVVNIRKITIWHNEDVHSFVLIIVRKQVYSNIRYIRCYFRKVMLN
jgi:hypothetical protein